MAKQADIEPRWLVGLMCQWARHELAVQDRSLGYPGKAAGFSEKTTGGYNHSNPTGFAAKDFRDLDAALEECRQNALNLWAALMMYYKPWVVTSFVAEGFPFGAGNKTYYNRLHEAHRRVAAHIVGLTEEVS